MRYLTCWLAAIATVTAMASSETKAMAAATAVKVRIEGRSETLFEGPVLTDVHRVRASSDTKWRRCDGVNPSAPQNEVPGVVPTSAAADAMRIVGQSFDGQWSNLYGDYLLKRWATDAQNQAEAEYWGVAVNNVFTAVGGCQYQLDGGDEVLWVYDAFGGRQRLALYPAGYTGGAEPLTAIATLNQPFELEVGAWPASGGSQPPASPERAATPYMGAEVSPVLTGASGFQKADLSSPATVVSGADGKASVTFTVPGWHRIKATDVVAGAEVAVRSNRLDVCVPEPPASDCGPLPEDAQVRTPPPRVPDELEGEGGSGGGEDPPDGGGTAGGGAPGEPGPESTPAMSTAPPSGPGPVRLRRPALDRRRLAQGLVGVSWRVIDPGPGIARWTISSRGLGRKGGRWISRASGSERAEATLRLPSGRTYRLRLIVVDTFGARSTVPLGTVQVPR